MANVTENQLDESGTYFVIINDGNDGVKENIYSGTRRAICKYLASTGEYIPGKNPNGTMEFLKVDLADVTTKLPEHELPDSIYTIVDDDRCIVRKMSEYYK